MSERTPVIAANWKMNKTLAEARDVLRSLLPQVERARRGARGDRSARPTSRCRSSPSSASSSAVEVAAQNMHYEEARRLHRRGLGGDAARRRGRRRRPRPLRAPPALRRDGRGAGRARSRSPLDAGLTPILCVGETDAAARAPTRPTGSCAARSTPASRASADERLAEVVVAYEPIWAIGTGKTATAEQAEDACGFIRSLVAARDAEAAAERSGSCTAARSSRPTRPSCSGATEIDGALVGGASLDPDDFAAIVAAADERAVPEASRDRSLPVDGVALVILDGWGLADPGPGNAVSPGRDAHLRRALGALTRTRSSRPPGATSGCPTGRWATPRSAT